MSGAEAGAPTPCLRVREAGIVWRETSGEIVVLDLGESVYFGLNPSGAILWKRLIDGATRSELIELLRASGADGEQAPREVDEFLSALGGLGLLAPVAG